MRNLTVKGMVMAARTRLKMVLDAGQVAQQAGAAVAGDDALGGAAEVEVDDVEAGVLADAGGLGEGLGVGAEELCGDGVLVVVVGEVALALGLAHAGEAVGRGELGHDEAAAGVLLGGGVGGLRLVVEIAVLGRGWSGELLAFLMKRRKTVSVTPAMGARTVAGAMWTLPMWRDGGDAGLRSGMVWASGMSQCLRFWTWPGGRAATHARAPGFRERPPRVAEAFGSLGRLEFTYLAAAALPASDWANLRRKRSIRVRRCRSASACR